MSRRARAPGPRGRDLLRTVLARRADPVSLHRHLRETYGPVVHVRMGAMSQLLLSDPEGVRHVLLDNAHNYTKGPGYELLARLLGRGLITSEGEHWRAHRRLVQPVLHRDRLAGFVEVMAACAADEAEALAALAARRATVDVFDRMMALALRNIARTVLGAEVEDREAKVKHALGVVFDQIERLSVSRLRYLELLPGGGRLRGLLRFAGALPTPARRRFDEAIRALDDVIYALVARRRREGPAGDGAHDLIGLLLRASETEGAALSDEDVRDEVMTMFVAGHETVATTLTWTLYLLARHPGYAARIAAEADAVLGGTAPTLDDLARLETAERVFQEGARLYPSVWRLSRWAIGPDRVCGYDVPAGSVVTVSPFLLHREPAYWPDPERFDPDRFGPAGSRDRPREAYLPFGAGQRKCPGGSFATAEAQIVLSALCRRVVFEVPAGYEPAFEARIALRPGGGMPLRLVPAERSSPHPAT